MKKSLVITLALVFVLGIAGTAFAANPFTDVPANHWAYAAVSKLAQEGVIEGYGDGRYFGNRTITRYEMAQIVAKAMANMDKANSASRAQIEKLAAEYADELDSLGVRVAKLEKNADNVSITGEAQFSHYAYKKDAHGDNTTLRSRLWVNGQVNDNWKYVAMIEHDNNDLHNNGNQGTIDFRRAWVEGNIGTVNVIAGRYNYIPMYGTVLDDDVEGLILNYSTGKFEIDLFGFRPDAFAFEAGDPDYSNSTVYGTNLRYGINDNFNVRGAYYRVDFSNSGYDNFNIFELGADYAFNDNFSMWAEYLRGDDIDNEGYGKNGWAAGLQFGEADIAKPGTWQLTGGYYDVPSAGYIAMTTEFSPADWSDDRGMKGWTVGASYVAAKNIDLNVEYFDMKSQGEHADKEKGKLLWSYVRFYF